MISEQNKLIQVKISKIAYQYLQKYKSIFGISISRYCEMAIYDKIIKGGIQLCEEEEHEDVHDVVSAEDEELKTSSLVVVE